MLPLELELLVLVLPEELLLVLVPELVLVLVLLEELLLVLQGPQTPSALPVALMQVVPGQQSPSMLHLPQAFSQVPPWRQT